MNEFKSAVRAAVNKNKPTQCKCPICSEVIFVLYNPWADGIQAMCEGCGRYWVEGVAEGEAKLKN